MTAFGNQIRYVAGVFEARARPVDAGGRRMTAEKRAELAADYWRVVMQIAVSAAVLGVGLWLLATGDETQQKLAAGFIGTVIGFWLK